MLYITALIVRWETNKQTNKKTHTHTKNNSEIQKAAMNLEERRCGWSTEEHPVGSRGK